ncbi:hypothetical protein V6N11_035310 [Hibiscus sabdariffa]|uniref:Uncharacterized protein n=1 Tax=Hibiscus sabdariffa TaxID=183260 RepID=A0ABR2QZZ8_9ROSI
MLRSSRGYTVSDELVVDSQPQSSDQQDLPRTPSTSSLSFSHFAVSFFGSSPGPRFKCMKSDNRSGNLIRKLVLKGFCSTKEVQGFMPKSGIVFLVLCTSNTKLQSNLFEWIGYLKFC